MDLYDLLGSADRSLWFMIFMTFWFVRETLVKNFQVACFLPFAFSTCIRNRSFARNSLLGKDLDWGDDLFKSTFWVSLPWAGWLLFKLFTSSQKKRKETKTGHHSRRSLWSLVDVLRSIEVRNAQLRQLLYLGIWNSLRNRRTLLLCSTMPYS